MSVFNALTWQNVTGPKEGTQTAITASALANDTINKALTGFSKALGGFQTSMEDRATGEILGNVMAQGTGKGALEAIKNGSIYGDINKNYINSDARAKAMGAVNSLLNNDISQYKLDELMPLEAEAKRVAMQEARSRMASAGITNAINQQRLIQAQMENGIMADFGNHKTLQERQAYLSGLNPAQLAIAKNKGLIDEDTFKSYTTPLLASESRTADGSYVPGTGRAETMDETLVSTLTNKYKELEANYNSALATSNETDNTLIEAVLNLDPRLRGTIEGADELKNINNQTKLANFSVPEAIDGALANLGTVGALGNQAKQFLNTEEDGLTVDKRALMARENILGTDFNKMIEETPLNSESKFWDSTTWNYSNGVIDPLDPLGLDGNPTKEAALKIENQIKSRKGAQTKLGEAEKILREFEKDPIKEMDLISPEAFQKDPVGTLNSVNAIADNTESLIKTIGLNSEQYLLENEYGTDKRSVPELLAGHEGVKGMKEGKKEDLAKNINDIAVAKGVPPRVVLEAIAKVKGTYETAADSLSNSDVEKVQKIIKDYTDPGVREKVLNRNQVVKEEMNKINTIKTALAASEARLKTIRQRPDIIANDPNAIPSIQREIYYWYMQLYNTAESTRGLYKEINNEFK